MDKNRSTSILVALIGGSIVGVLYWYNKQPHAYEEYLLTNIGALLWLPMMVVFLVLRQEPSGFGFALGDSRRGFKQAVVLYAIALPLLVLAARMEAFQNYYPIDKRALNTLRDFARFELTYGMYLFCWEFFFRGFLLFGLYRLIGTGSVFVQAAAFGIMHLGKPGPEIAASFAAGIILGVVALRAKSFLPCFVLHWAVSLTFDVLIILTTRGVIW